MTQQEYAQKLEAAATVENIRMRQSLSDSREAKAGGNPKRVPEKLLVAARHLLKKRSLTANDLANRLQTKQPNALALLTRLERLGVATSEVHSEARVRIFSVVVK